MRRDNLKSWMIDNHLEGTEEQYLLKVKDLIKHFNNIELNILPYEKLIDVENAGQTFVNNLTEGLLFRIYVPNKKLWSNEFDKFITLFREYASVISGKELIIKQQRTDIGVVCSLYSQNKDIDEQEINILYSEFSNFMDICAINPSEASKIINKSKLPQEQRDTIFQKYIKEAQRLQLDIKHERELKLLQIKQCLELELQEVSINDELTNYINQKVPIALSDSSFSRHKSTHTQIININPQIIGKVEGVVSRVVNGGIELSNEEREICKLIELYSAKATEVESLKSAIYELRDNAISKDEKKMAWQKLYGFIGKIGDKIGDVGVSLLSKYLEQKIGI